MADPAKFDHDRLGHLLSDQLLKVPGFQRRYSWEAEHVSEYWSDIDRARLAGDSYFMGTVVLAADPAADGARLIIDGQQRISTTALLFVAIRDRLKELSQDRASSSVESTHLSDYVLTQEENVAKLTLSPDDHPAYSALLESRADSGARDPVSSAYFQLKGLVDGLAPTEDEYRKLIDLVNYLDNKVQVLLAVASTLQEAYVIFETLNDRGADLTTADLLKNYLFSGAGQAITYAESAWTRLSGRFDKPDDFVKFLRYEYMSRRGRVTNRGLYKALQSDIGQNGVGVRAYLERLEVALGWYVALREPDDASWSAQAIEVKDSLLAFRRFGFEASMPLLLAAFATWKHSDATRFVDVVASWSVRAWMAGTLGGGVAETAFCEAAVAISSGAAAKSDDVRIHMKDLVPDDATFKQAFLNHSSISTTRAKYILARLERQSIIAAGASPDGMPDWSSKSVSVEHIFAKSSKLQKFGSQEEFERFQQMRDRLQNLTLLERGLNGGLEDKPFDQKRATYAESKFVLTHEVASLEVWGFDEAESRAKSLADLAVLAWPA